MYLYQLGYFGYDEGEMIPNVILEHDKKYSEKEISAIAIEIRSKHSNSSLSQEQISEILQKEYGFIVKETIAMDVGFWW